jgi:cholesterol transport system auxiliary component
VGVLGTRFWRAVRMGLAAGATIVAAACSTPATPVPTFDLIAPRDFGHVRPARGLLAIAVPTALQALDTEKIMIEPAPGEVTYASDAQWSDRLPRLLQARIVETFENGTRIRTVARAGDRVSADAQLVTDIRQFSIQVGNSGKEAVVELSVKIIGERGGRIAAAKVFYARVPAAGANGAAAVNALNEALANVLVELVRWTATKI